MSRVRGRAAQKRRLRKIIREAVNLYESHGNMPCPIETANQLKASGAQPDEVMAWIGELMDVYRGAASSAPEAAPSELMPVPDPLATIALERYHRSRSSYSGDRNDMNSRRLTLGSTMFGVGFEK
jgi:hypothetical protein